MAACVAVRVSATQPQLPDGISTAAEALLAALRAPIKVEWEVDVGVGAVAKFSAEVTHEQSAWPPRMVELRVVSTKGPSFGVRVPTAATPEQLELLLVSGVDLLEGERRDEPAEAHAVQLPFAVAGSVPVVDEDRDRQVIQPRCLQQWHHDICGHHALFNVRRLLGNAAGGLENESLFWLEALRDVEALARHGEESGRWPRSRVQGGVADEAHLRHLIAGDPSLAGRVTVVGSKEALARVEVQEALEVLGRHGRESPAHGFLLGGRTHWYSAVAAPSQEGPRLFLCNSYNIPLARLRVADDVEALVEAEMVRRRRSQVERLQRQPDWAHRPYAHIESAVDDGIQEWWKGALRSALFWRQQPLHLQQQLQIQEYEDVRCYIETLLQAMQPAQAQNSSEEQVSGL